MKAIPMLCLAAGLCAANVQAEALVNATDPERVMELVRGFGSATLEQDAYGDPKITGRIDGHKFNLYFYGCDDNRNCSDLQFAAAWAGQDVSLRRINEWNKTTRYGKAYLDSDGDPTLEMTVNLKYGVSRDNFDDTIDWWKLAMSEFVEHLNAN